jgi:hypothetical protein
MENSRRELKDLRRGGKVGLDNSIHIHHALERGLMARFFCSQLGVIGLSEELRAEKEKENDGTSLDDGSESVVGKSHSGSL